jgi:hypothetical protein
MERRRANRSGNAFGRRRSRRIAFVAGAILISSAFGAPSAPATLAGEVTGGVGATVEAVEATPNAAPSLPSAIPPAAPPAPIATPTTPQAPVNLQTEAAPAPSPSPPSSGSNLPSAGEIASVGTDAVGSVTSIDEEATPGVDAPARGEGSRVSTLSSSPNAGPSKAAPRASDTPTSASRSLTAAIVAASGRWFVRVWPAISLGGGAGQGWAAEVLGGLFRPAATTARLLVLAPLAARAASGSPLVGHPGTANAPQFTLPATAEVEGTLYLIVLAALLALLAVTIWREFHSARRARVHW